MTTPTVTARNEASAIARAGSPSASISGAMVAAITGPSAESGPSTNTRDGPKAAYPSRHRIEVYRPVIGDSPASAAYAMPCGTSSADSTSPATTSLGNHARWYDVSTPSPGTCARRARLR
jgi:hypothetical protein